MPLDDAELESVREIVGYKTLATITLLCAELNAAGEAAMRADIAVWEEKKNKSGLKIKGSSDGVDLDNDRTLRKVRIRVMERLGLPVSSNGFVRIPVVSASYSDCDY